VQSAALEHATSGYDWTLFSVQRDARAAKVGLWMDPQPVAPWEWRKTSRGDN
jgi:endonuclease YncB( thermonuclease family)